MLGALFQSGYRAESVNEIRWDLHVQIGDPTVGISPDVESTLRIHFRAVLRGRYARFLIERYVNRVLIHHDVRTRLKRTVRHGLTATASAR